MHDRLQNQREGNALNELYASNHALTWVTYHQFYIAELEGVFPEWGREGENNGLIATGLGSAVIHTGIADGQVDVSVEAYGSEPPLVLEDWDDVVEVAIDSPTGELQVRCLDDDPPTLPNLASSGPGTYRLRVHVRGRDTAPDAATDDVTESYLIQTWPSADKQEIVHQQKDNYGTGMRVSVARNRSSRR